MLIELEFGRVGLYGGRKTGKVGEKPLEQGDTQQQTQPTYGTGSGARFSKAPETSLAPKAIFSSSVSKNGEVYTPETSCMKGASLHIKNM